MMVICGAAALFAAGMLILHPRRRFPERSCILKVAFHSILGNQYGMGLGTGSQMQSPELSFWPLPLL